MSKSHGSRGGSKAQTLCSAAETSTASALLCDKADTGEEGGGSIHRYQAEDRSFHKDDAFQVHAATLTEASPDAQVFCTAALFMQAC